MRKTLLGPRTSLNFIPLPKVHGDVRVDLIDVANRMWKLDFQHGKEGGEKSLFLEEDLRQSLKNAVFLFVQT